MSEEKIAYIIRPMRRSDFPQCQWLREQAGWNQTLVDWERFLSCNPGGCFVAEARDAVVGSVCTVAYPPAFGWVAMVLVDPGQRRQGIGKALLRAGIEHLQGRGLSVKLDATPEGKMLYDTLGFVDEYQAWRMESGPIYPPEAHPDCTPVSLEDLDELDRFDQPIFGSSRREVLASYLRAYPQYGFLIRRDGEIQGYILARDGVHAFHIGPWVAYEAEDAVRLLHTMLHHHPAPRIFIDVLEPNPHVRVLLAEMGFRMQRSFIRMVLGPNDHPGKPHLVYSLSGPELG